jgi:hypothetical protein
VLTDFLVGLLAKP